MKQNICTILVVLSSTDNEPGWFIFSCCQSHNPGLNRWFSNTSLTLLAVTQLNVLSPHNSCIISNSKHTLNAFSHLTSFLKFLIATESRPVTLTLPESPWPTTSRHRWVQKVCRCNNEHRQGVHDVSTYLQDTGMCSAPVSQHMFHCADRGRNHIH